MTAFRTCHTCAKPAATCPTRATLQAALTGLSITSVMHRCADYVAAFLPGEPVRVQTRAWYQRDDDPAPKLDFPGHFIRLSGSAAIVHVKSGVEDLNGEGVAFEPNGNGYLKIPLRRIAARDGDPVSVEACRWCAAILDVGDPCGRDPHYTPSSSCLAETRRVKASQSPVASDGEATKRAALGRPNPDQSTIQHQGEEP